MKQKVNINNKSIETAGITKDYKESLAEFIWNSFDAKATEVRINFEDTPIGTPAFIEIMDNGSGINHDNIDNTFGAFLDSEKRNSLQRSSYIHGKKGKGRFSFISFSDRAEWDTVYKDEDDFYTFTILIESYDKDHYALTQKVKAKNDITGTTLRFSNFHNISTEALNSPEFKNFLKMEFGWFLFLNENRKYAIYINGDELKYNELIAETDRNSVSIDDNDFKITYIRWTDKIGDKYYYYFLDDEKVEKAKGLTSFNKNAIDFHHSVYVESQYFNDYYCSQDDVMDDQITLVGKTFTDIVFKKLQKYLREYLEDKRRGFVQTVAPRLINKYEEEGVFPTFSNSKYDQERKKDLKEVAQELYCIQPRIFIGLNYEQQKSFFGFLNLILDSDERENIITIIDSIIKLTSREREDLCNVIKKSSLQKIVRTMKLIESRYNTIELLKTLVYDLKKFTNERDHIQKTVEENYWLFGEQYHLVSADKNFEIALSEYRNKIGDDTEKRDYTIENEERLRRPDIFVCRKRNLEYDETTELEENIIVELKDPSVKIGKKQFRQTDDYLELISNEPKFNSQTRRWKFILVSCKVDDYIKSQYKVFADKGKRFLVHQKDNYEIYAMTWDDVFRTFEIRHRFIYEKLDFDKKAIEEELQIKGIKLSRQSSDEIRDKVLSLSEKRKSI